MHKPDTSLTLTCRYAIIVIAHQPAGSNLSGTAVARIMHGLSTPAYPSDQWCKCGFWGK